MKYEIKFNQINFNECNEVEGKTVVEFLQLFKVSKKNIHILFQEKRLRLNREIATRESRLKKEDILTIQLPEEEIDYAYDNQSAQVVYEDDLVLIVHKDAGIIVHDEKEKSGTLANQVATYYAQTNQNHAVRYIHRLDEETKGLVFFSKISLLQPWFDDELKEKKIKRFYYAVVEGEMKIGKKQTINQPIGRNRHDAKKMIIASSGKEATTKIQCINSKNGLSLIQCELETGRTHQIRVHLASIGYSIVNDEYYGSKTSKWKGMGLYAYKLEWQEIFTNKKRVITDPYLEELEYFKVR